jgi:protein-L-isoaspartate(D-aspartate) O-methyltransferase
LVEESAMATVASLRKVMVEVQLVSRGVRDPHVLRAMRMVPREDFVSEALREFAYEDRPLPIEAGQTISQPYIVALMIEQARINPGDTVLEIGAGSGYAAAIMSRIAGKIYSIERHDELARLARQRTAALGYDNIEIHVGDGAQGWPEVAPFDAILIAAGAPSIPEPLYRQLKLGGRLVMPVGAADQQRLLRVVRQSENRFGRENLGPVRFVPLMCGAAEPAPEIDDPEAGAGFPQK